MYNMKIMIHIPNNISSKNQLDLSLSNVKPDD